MLFLALPDCWMLPALPFYDPFTEIGRLGAAASCLQDWLQPLGHILVSLARAGDFWSAGLQATPLRQQANQSG